MSRGREHGCADSGVIRALDIAKPRSAMAHNGAHVYFGWVIWG